MSSFKSFSFNKLSPTLLMLLLVACGAGTAPVDYVDFEEEFRDTTNVKAVKTEYGQELQKDYRDMYWVEREYNPESTELEQLQSNATTTDTTSENYREYKGRLVMDADLEWRTSDNAINPTVQIIFEGKDKDKKCSKIKISADAKGIDLSYTVSRSIILGRLVNFYKFDDYKKDCDQALSAILTKLASEKAYKFSYWYLSKVSDLGFVDTDRVKTKSKLVHKAKIVRKLYRVNPEELRVGFDEFLARIAAMPIELQYPDDPNSLPLMRTSYITIVKDPSVVGVSPLTLRLNTIKEDTKVEEWKQKIFDPYSGPVRRAVMSIMFMPATIFMGMLGADTDQMFKPFEFKHCQNVYISSTLKAVDMSLSELPSKEESQACYGELESFFKGRSIHFDYVREEALPIPAN